MKSDFSSLGIAPPILQAIRDMGFEKPTEVQRRAIPHVLNQEDVIVMSKTGSGKTAVFGVPLLQLIDPAAQGPQGLILTPTRELAVQVDSDLKRMAKYLNHKTTAVYGQHSMDSEIQALNNGISIVTGTPGRVYDHIYHGHLKTRNIKYLVLDEADRMLDMGFLDQVVRIVKTLPRNRITMLFSATIPPEVHSLCQRYMKDPVAIEIESRTKTVETTDQVYYRVNHNEKNTKLNRLLLMEQPESCVIFCNQRSTVDRVQSFLDRKGYAVRSLHGDIPQSKRTRTIQQFKQGDFHLLVATDVAARGLHIEDLALVINYDIPLEKDGYVHRIGRTGRAGKGGKAISLVTSDDIMSLYEIEEHIGALIEEAFFPPETDMENEKTAAEAWLQSNTQKRKKLMTGSGPAASSSKTPIKRSNQPKSQPKPEPSAQPKPNKSKPQEPMSKDVQPRPKLPVQGLYGSQPTQSASTGSRLATVIRVQTITKPETPAVSPERTVLNSRENASGQINKPPQQSSVTADVKNNRTGKKSLMQQLVQRIWGRAE